MESEAVKANCANIKGSIPTISPRNHHVTRCMLPEGAFALCGTIVAILVCATPWNLNDANLSEMGLQNQARHGNFELQASGCHVNLCILS